MRENKVKIIKNNKDSENMEIKKTNNRLSLKWLWKQ